MGTYNRMYFAFQERKDYEEKTKAFDLAFEQGFESEQELESNYQKFHKELLGYEADRGEITFLLNDLDYCVHDYGH